MNTPTPHNEAGIEDIAPIVLMPGDPLRAKYIADNYLCNAVLYNKVRNMYGFTGTYKGIRISVQSSGMGIPSMGIYSKELFEAYGVDTIIRVGTAGSLQEDTKLRDIIIAETVNTDSNYLKMNCGENAQFPAASSYLISQAHEISKANNIDIRVGNIFTSDTFYSTKEQLKECAKSGSLAVEMETLALYTNAKMSNKKAMAILTISDKPLENISLSSKDRQESFNTAVELALEIAIKCAKEGN